MQQASNAHVHGVAGASCAQVSLCPTAAHYPAGAISRSIANTHKCAVLQTQHQSLVARPYLAYSLVPAQNLEQGPVWLKAWFTRKALSKALFGSMLGTCVKL